MKYYKPIKENFNNWNLFVNNTGHKDNDLYWISTAHANSAHFTNKRTGKTVQVIEDRFELYKTKKSHLPKWW